VPTVAQLVEGYKAERMPKAGFRIYASSRDRSRLSAQIEGEHHMLDRILDL